MPPRDVPDDVAAIRSEINRVLATEDSEGRSVGDAKFGVYAFYDYDREPIYVGQTSEKLRTRIRRHLTNQRTDAVAMNVLDPFEVADIEMWPFFEFEGRAASDPEACAKLDAAEYSVYVRLLGLSTFQAVLNEGNIPERTPIDLPSSVRGRIVPAGMFEVRSHPDIRIARRANTIANLAKVISERDVSTGLRRTLITQARRLEHLARRRFEEVGGEVPYEVSRGERGERVE
jgi:hypothetical protein